MPVQERAVSAILSGDADVLIAAPTAGGKTEAAFLPILTHVASNLRPSGIQVLALSPLKALINDQHQRLEELAGAVDIECHRWHGDVSGSRKQALLKRPRGVLYITPESLEALFVRHGSELWKFFCGLAFVVVDELHAFIGNVRGKQLQSLLHRLEKVVNRAIPRVALSATIGDLRLAARFLRPVAELPCHVIEDTGNNRTLLLQLKGVLVRKPISDTHSEEKAGLKSAVDEARNEAVINIANHLFVTLRGSHNMVFANAKKDVEFLTDALRTCSEQSHVPNEFYPHHGNLAKEYREEAEDKLRNKNRPATAICTNTLELGIDVGSVSSIAQLECPPSVAALRQRLGRSGRRPGEPSILRIFCREEELSTQSTLWSRLRAGQFQAIAMLELLLQGWVEPPDLTALHCSTLVQQLLSAIAQHGGLSAIASWNLLCNGGPFQGLTKGQFVSLLKALGEHDVLAQAGDGTLLPGDLGERLINHYSFYAAFSTPEEYRLEYAGKAVGVLSIQNIIRPDEYLIFAGRRWLVREVDTERKVISLVPGRGGRVPTFFGESFVIHDRVVKTMRACYSVQTPPRYLDETARRFFNEGCTAFHNLGLTKQSVVLDHAGVTIFPWAGTLVLQTLAILLANQGLKVEDNRIALRIDEKHNHVCLALKYISEEVSENHVALAKTVPIKVREKYDRFLGDEVLDLEFTARNLRVPEARAVAGELCSDNGWN